MSRNQIKIIETVLTDSNERLLNNHMLTEEMLPILEYFDQAGYYAIECLSRSVFESAFLTLDDPWTRLKEIKSIVKNTKLLLTMQGARIFSDKLYPDSMVSSFVEICAENGISVFRLYDQDNDLEKLKTACKAAKKAGAEVQIALVYKEGISQQRLSDQAGKVQNMGADSIFIRDEEGILSPYKAAAVYDDLSEAVSVPLGLEMHQNNGFADMSYLKAAEHGCRLFDTTISSLCGTASHPATEVIAKAVEGTDMETGLDSTALQKTDDYMRRLSEDFMNIGIFKTDKMTLDLRKTVAAVPQETEEFIYDDLTEDDIMRIRAEIALVERDQLDVVTYALYPEVAKEYLSRRVV